MSDNDGKKTLGVRGGPRSGNVKQSFSHGRTKSVVVETKRKRVVVPKPGEQKSGSGVAARVMSDPSSTMRPERGLSRPATARIVVVLPQPDGPSRATSSPFAIVRSSRSTATVSP